MSTLTTEAARPPKIGVDPILAAIVLTAAVCAALGILLSLAVVDQPAAHAHAGATGAHHHGSTSALAGRVARTAFGDVAVEDVQELKGLTRRQLAGVNHGIQNLVGPDKAQVQLTVALHNGRGGTVDYSTDQFRMYAGNSRRAIQPLSSTIGAGTLQPDASIEGVMGFVVPRNGARISLAFDDRAGDRTIRIDLGRTDKASASDLAEAHSHNH
jgi:hypothetical protein